MKGKFSRHRLTSDNQMVPKRNHKLILSDMWQKNEDIVERLSTATSSIDRDYSLSTCERSSVEENRLDNEKVYPFVTARELFERECDEIPSLIEPIFPKVGIVSVVGSSDTGKSTFLRQLAFSVAYGEPNFLGFPINAEFNRAIYVSTEDDEHSINKLLKIQFGVPDNLEKAERLKYVFETENLINNLDDEMSKVPVDLIIIDAFADLYTGELNANNRVRGFLNVYRELALKHKCLIIFLHHTGKRTEQQIPSKNNAIGSQGFEAKMRLMIELRKDLKYNQIRHLCIVKGNYLPEEFKTHSIVTKFNENMLFENLNCSVPFGSLKSHTDDKDEAIKLAHQLRSDMNLPYSKISEVLKEEGFDYSKSTIGGWLKK